MSTYVFQLEIFPFEFPIIKPYFAEDNDQITEIKKSSIGFRQ